MHAVFLEIVQAMPEMIQEEITAPCDTRHLAAIREMIKSTASRCFGQDTLAAKITLAVDEAVANVMEHAYEGMENGDVRVAVYADGEKFTVTVTDQGRQFNPDSIANPNILMHVKEGKRNGLGIFIIRQVMDEIKYTFVQNKHNELRMVKYISNGK